MITPPNITLRAWQETALPIALKALEEGRSGVIRAATGAGKSIFQGTLLLNVLGELGPGEHIVVSVPTQNLVEQLHGTLSSLLGPANVGRYYANRKEIRPVIVTCHPSLYRHPDPAPRCAHCTPGLIPLSGARAASARKQLFVDAVAGKGGCAHTDHVEVGVPPAEGGLALSIEGRVIKLWLADECHKTEQDSVLNWLASAAPERRIGFTATPWRASGNISSFDELLFDYGPGAAIEDGVLLLPRVVFAKQALDGDRLSEGIVAMVKDHVERHPGPGVISCRNIEESDQLARELTAAGLPSASVHSRLPREVRDARLTALREGTLTALTYVNMLSEGVDYPWLTWLCLGRPASTVVRFPQEVGRVMRVHEGKEACYILDPLGVYLSHDFESQIRLGEYEEDPDLPPDPNGSAAPEVASPPKKPKTLTIVAPGEVEAWLELARKTASLKRLLPPRESWMCAPRLKLKPATAKQVGFIERLAGAPCARAQLAQLDQDYVSNLRTAYRARADLSVSAAGCFVDLLKLVIWDKKTPY